MFRSLTVRILICCSLIVSAVVGGMLILPAIRHRHDGGEIAHSHGGHSHGGHSHGGHSHGGHSHGAHSHAGHTHSDGQRHDSHSHSHSHDEHHGGISPADHSHGHDDPDHEPSAHIHLTVFGFELTLPDFLGGVTAPLVDEKATSKEYAAPGDTIQLPVPFSFAQLVNVTLRWVAIVTPGIDREDGGHEFRVALILSERDPGLDGSAPPVPPPKAS